jgi:nucleotide-binding universal stress UspA family protein
MTAMQHHGSEAAEDVRSYVMDFEQIGSRDLGRVAGKNSSLGELFRALRERRAPIVLLHAYHVPYEGTHPPEAVLLDAISAADASVKRRIEEVAANFRASGIRIDTVTWEGDPPETILRHAKSIVADLIAMGMQGLSALNRLLLGCTTERVVASAPCPVLTVRHGSA